MPSSNLAAYLAKNYLTASPASSHPNEPPKKKRKSKHLSAVSGLVIADDDEGLGLSAAHKGAGANGQDDDGNTEAPTFFEGKPRSAEFRRAKKSTWQSLSGPEPTSTGATNQNDSTAGRNGGGHDDNGDDADKLLRTAQADEARRLAEQEAENAPAIVEMDVDPSDDKGSTGPTMSNGLRAGLQTAADTARLVAAQERADAEAQSLRTRQRKKSRRQKKDGEAEEEEEEETIYRDATGRRIDISLRRAEARREEAERARAQRQDKLDAMGEVQRDQREQRRQELDEAKFLALGRTVEDDEYNDRLRDVVRWDDPMAAYMAEKKAQQNADDDDDDDDDDTDPNNNKKPTTRRAGGKPQQQKRRREYLGPAPPPNRYGIKPGWRWDGVDRSNGFERDWFQARSRRGRNEQLSYEWQMDE